MLAPPILHASDVGARINYSASTGCRNGIPEADAILPVPLGDLGVQ